MSNCHLVAVRSLSDLAASRLALRAPALRGGYGLDSAQSISAAAIVRSPRCVDRCGDRPHRRRRLRTTRVSSQPFLADAVRIAVLVNPANIPATESTLRDIPDAARAMGLQIQLFKASTRSEIEAAFAILVHDVVITPTPKGWFVMVRDRHRPAAVVDAIRHKPIRESPCSVSPPRYSCATWRSNSIE